MHLGTSYILRSMVYGYEVCVTVGYMHQCYVRVESFREWKQGAVGGKIEPDGLVGELRQSCSQELLKTIPLLVFRL